MRSFNQLVADHLADWRPHEKRRLASAIRRSAAREAELVITPLPAPDEERAAQDAADEFVKNWLSEPASK